MSYYKKILLAVAFCATLGLHSAGAIKFNDLTEQQQVLMNSRAITIAQGTNRLSSIEKYVNQCIEQLKKNNPNPIETYTQEVFINLLKDSEAAYTINYGASGLGNKDPNLKEAADNSAQTLLDYINNRFLELRLIPTIYMKNLTKKFINKDVQFFKELSIELHRINETIKNATNFGSNDDNWADFLFGDHENKKTITGIPTNNPDWTTYLFMKKEEKRQRQRTLANQLASSLVRAVARLEFIDDYLDKCIEQFHKDDPSEIDNYSAEKFAFYVKTFRRVQALACDLMLTQLSYKRFNVKEEENETVMDLFKYIRTEFDQIFSFDEKELAKRFMSKDVNFLVGCSTKVKDVMESVQNRLNWKNDEKGWADFLFGEPEDIKENKQTLKGIPVNNLKPKDNKDNTSIKSEARILLGYSPDKHSLPKKPHLLIEEKKEISTNISVKNPKPKDNNDNTSIKKQELIDRLLEKLDLLCADFPKDLVNIKADDEQKKLPIDQKFNAITIKQINEKLEHLQNKNMHQSFNNNNSSGFENGPVILNENILKEDLPQITPGEFLNRDVTTAKIIIKLSPKDRTTNGFGYLNESLEKIRGMPEQDAKKKGLSLIWKLLNP
jgi:hypothetical protein